MLEGPLKPVDVFLSVGSNIEAEEHLHMACRELALYFGDLTLSSVYRNQAVGFEGDDFLNMVIGFNTTAKPEQVFGTIQDLHAKAGRVYHDDPFCSRTLDLDMLLYGSLVQSRLKLPHADIEKYGYVVGPMAEVAPQLRHPVNGMTMQDIWKRFDQDDNPLHKVDIGLN
jgi:2-amino-4-hydroxy-6-hydroxymethyldihydropteridine diphosphokinase